MRISNLCGMVFACIVAATPSTTARTEQLSELRLDFASHNPVSLVLNDRA